jgi:hypothetical protein
MAYRDDVTALAARHTALSQELAEKQREVVDTRNLLEQARARLRLPVLENLRVASPCTADWNKMTGDERARHCGDCQKTVYNLSGLTRDEAEALLIEKNGNLCVRYYQRKDGTILLADCEVGVKRNRRRRWIAAGAATLLAGGAGVIAYRALHHEEPTPLMGATVGMPTVTVTDVQQVTGGTPIEPPVVYQGLPAIHEPAEPLMGKVSMPTTPPAPKHRKR